MNFRAHKRAVMETLVRASKIASVAMFASPYPLMRDEQSALAWPFMNGGGPENGGAPGGGEEPVGGPSAGELIGSGGDPVAVAAPKEMSTCQVK